MILLIKNNDGKNENCFHLVVSTHFAGCVFKGVIIVMFAVWAACTGNVEMILPYIFHLLQLL